ncbi:hypothetical protein [Mycolicibacterium arenosum]|uniref:Uncharacterized protein n=1 Tax=Mycolicibacterium arenosum TaxID=2952157 RepID=A0ABT1M0V4_9MYCO|nr:hypothetical protein [Mycolicibacterium sp. CAU 1645]MCP9272776.1 hypothetical protein [Mycolicibacterium sp. CAU 1645]
MIDDADTREFVHHLFGDDADAPPVPRDVTSTPIPLTRERLKRESALVGTVGRYTTGGELVEMWDDDAPLYAAPIESHDTLIGPFVYFDSQIRALGITADELARDFPGIHTMPDPR